MRGLLLFLVLVAGITPGDYKGKWQGGQANGDMRITLKQAQQEGQLDAVVTFTLSGEEVKCQVTSVKTDGTKLTMVYTFDLGGYKLESTLDGELKGSTLEGKYRTREVTSGEAVDQGTWTAAR